MFKYDKNIHVLASKRSGHHAITDWICKLYFMVEYLNDVCGKIYYIGTKGPSGKRSTDPNVNDMRLVYLTSTENMFPDQYISTITSDPLFNNEVFEGPTTFMLILRDPYNQIASLLKQIDYGRVELFGDAVSFFETSWIALAKEFIKETTFMPKHTLRVSYNKWFESRSYRDQIATGLDTINEDRDVNIMSQAIGSSFDGKEFFNNAQKMKVLERWKHYVGHPMMESIVNNKEITELSMKIFPVVTQNVLKSKLE